MTVIVKGHNIDISPKKPIDANSPPNKLSIFKIMPPAPCIAPLTDISANSIFVNCSGLRVFSCSHYHRIDSIPPNNTYCIINDESPVDAKDIIFAGTFDPYEWIDCGKNRINNHYGYHKNIILFDLFK